MRQKLACLWKTITVLRLKQWYEISDINLASVRYLDNDSQIILYTRRRAVGSASLVPSQLSVYLVFSSSGETDHTVYASVYLIHWICHLEHQTVFHGIFALILNPEFLLECMSLWSKLKMSQQWNNVPLFPATYLSGRKIATVTLQSQALIKTVGPVNLLH